MQGWTEQEYFFWLQKHENEREQWDLVEKAVDDQVKGRSDSAESGDEEDQKYLNIFREVLEHARGRIE